MLRSKVDVDRHVAKTLAKLKTEKDKNFRAYSIARLYLDVGDYETASRYAQLYLTVKDDSALAHALLAQACQQLGQVERALQHYSTALSLDPQQDSLLLKVCELLGADTETLEVGRARYWLERASAVYPEHRATFRLRQRLLAAEGGDQAALADLLRQEAATRPRDPAPQAKLIKHLLANNQTIQAFKHAHNIQFTSAEQYQEACGIWDDAISQLIECIKPESIAIDINGWDYWIVRLTSLERAAFHALNEKKTSAEACTALWRLDQALAQAEKNMLKYSPDQNVGKVALRHFNGQFCLHAATLLFKRARKEASAWRDAMKAAAPLLLMAYWAKPPSEVIAELPSSTPPGSPKRLLKSWQLSGAYRLSQAAHTLLSLIKEKRQPFLDKIKQYCSGDSWRDKLFKKIFTNREWQVNMKTSHLYSSDAFKSPELVLPRAAELLEWDLRAQSVNSSSLQDQVWLGLNVKNLSEFSSGQLDGLPSSINNLPNCGAETLNRLDMDAFLYCAVLTAKQKIENCQKSKYYDADRPHVLPTVITEPLCSPAQVMWWQCAFCISSGKTSEAPTDSRMTLTRGIATVRCIGDHGLDPQLLSELARIFSNRTKSAIDPTEKRFLEARVALYRSVAVPLLERARDNMSVSPPPQRLFTYIGPLSNDQLGPLIEEGKLFLAEQYMNENDYDKAVELLETLKSPYASFHLYKIFRKMADEEIKVNKESVTSEMRSKNVIFLTKARDQIYITMDRLKASHAENDHPLYSELADHIENIELLLSRIDPDMTASKKTVEGRYSSEESSVGSEHRRVRYSSRNEMPNTPKNKSHFDSLQRMETQPSPERLEAQIKQLQRKNSIMTAFIEQTKVLVETNRTLVDEVREMKKSFAENKPRHLDDTIDRFKGLELTVDEVKSKMNDYHDESAMNVADLKREISDLKREIGRLKNPADQPNLEDSELFQLEEESYAVGAGVQPGLPYFPRTPANPVGFPLYPPGALYPLYSGQYPQLPQLFPANMFPQDQTLYSELLNPRNLPQPAPVPAPIVPTLPPPSLQISTTVPVAEPPKIAAHNYQIPLPSMASSTPAKPPQLPVLPFNLFENAGINQSFGDSGLFNDSSKLNVSGSGVHNKSRTMSERSTDSYDPIPEFQPIIELPDEIQVTTGEEDEIVLFDARAKLFRFVDKEWKERGLGQMKLLKSKNTGKVRVLMRREQVHNICANHIITSDMDLTPMKDKDKAYFWVANDFADETLKLEQFCIRFKTVEIGKKFFDTFNAAKDQNKTTEKKKEAEVAWSKPPPAATIGGITFSSTPVRKTVDAPAPVCTATETPKANPFAGFTFSKTATTTPFSGFTPDKLATNTTTNEKVLFDRKAELLLFEKQTKKKVMGKGSVKVTADPNNVKKVKIVLRLDAGALVFCDHPITADMKFEKSVFQPSTVTWTTPEPASASIGVLFSHVEASDDLIKCIKDSQAKMTTDKPSAPMTGFGDVFKPKPAANTEVKAPVSSWGDQFKAKPGSWTCKSCYIVNEQDVNACLACQQPNPDLKAKETPAKPQEAPPKTTSSWGDQFKPKPGSWECSGCFINNEASRDYCVACDNPKHPGLPKKEANSALQSNTGLPKFNFGIPSNGPASTEPKKDTNVALNLETKKDASSIFGAAKPSVAASVAGFKFGLPPSQADVKVPEPVAPQAFQFTFKPQDAAANATSPVAVRDSPRRDSNGYAEEDDGAHLKFDPIIPLPAEVEVKTGEEDEQVLYCHLAKLFRFNSGEWKECGLGDVKILRNPQNGKLRVLMRRQNILKICLNHALTDAIEYSVKDEKSWLFVAQDFSTGEIVTQSYCIRFKNKAIANEFMDAINKARENLTKQPTPQPTNDKKDSDDEVNFVSETHVSEEDKKHARDLMLPDNFFAYKQKEPCTGCVGCNDENFVFDVKAKVHNEGKKEKTKTENKSVVEPAKTESPFAKFGFAKTQVVNDSVSKSDTKTLFSGQNTTFASNNTSSIQNQKTDAAGQGDTAKTPEKTGLLAPAKLATVTPPASTPALPNLSEPPPSSQSIFSGLPLFSGTPFGAKPQGSIFGGGTTQSPFAGNNASPFGQTTSIPFGDSTPKTSIFSKTTASPFSGANVNSTFGSPGNTPSIFGNSATTFGGTKNNSTGFGTNSIPFGSSNAIPFGSSPTSIPFGKTPANNGTSIFGGTGNKTIPFGGGEKTSIFGTGDAKTNLFGTGDAKADVFGTGENKPSIFGTPEPGKPLFGADTAAKTSIFGTPVPAKPLFGADTEGKTSIFGTPVPAKPLFGTDAAVKTSIFGTPVPAKPLFSADTEGKTGIFGTPEPAKPLFRSDTAVKTSNDDGNNDVQTLLSANTENKTSLLDYVANQATPFTSTENKTIPFSANTDGKTSLLGGTENKTSTSAATESKTSMFGSLNAPVFGSGATPFSGTNNLWNSTKPAETGGKENAAKDNLFAKKLDALGEQGDQAGLSFAALAAPTFATLAANNNPTETFTKAEDLAAHSFSWAGAGTPLFSSNKAGTANNTSNADNTASPNQTTEEEYDPYYEPIIAMPDQIEVITGEEDEKVMFEHNSKLFRWADGEWKERGIGDIKLLFHPQRHSYRLLMRQKQVHKVVLNQLVTDYLQVAPMKGSDRSFLWAGLNYTEDHPQGASEKLAVRFGSTDAAARFSRRIEEAIQDLQENKSNTVSNQDLLEAGDTNQSIPTTVTEVSITPAAAASNTETAEAEEDEDAANVYDEYDEDYQDEDYDDEQYDGDGGDYDADETVVYSGAAEVDGSSGFLSLVSGGDGAEVCGRLQLHATEGVLWEGAISTNNTSMKVEGAECIYSCEGERSVRIKLPTEDDAATLHASFYEVLGK